MKTKKPTQKNSNSETMTCLEGLALLYPENSRASLKKWLRAGRVYVDGKQETKATALVTHQKQISLGKKEIKKECPFPIYYEDSDLIVVEKPNGLLSVATDKDDGYESVHSVLKEYCEGKVFPVQRLDRETSGVMMFALSEKARRVLQEQFKKHSITREYRAIVEGVVQEESGTWKSHLKEDKNFFVRSHPSGVLAITHYKVLTRSRSHTQLAIRLETGKKNQVRVHCSEAGFPIVGDRRYGASANPLKRLGLHAHILGFVHPSTNEEMSFTSPLPAKFSHISSSV